MIQHRPADAPAQKRLDGFKCLVGGNTRASPLGATSTWQVGGLLALEDAPDINLLWIEKMRQFGEGMLSGKVVPLAIRRQD
jgi:hypothetical protein